MSRCPIHVDGASGGFLAPFCAPDLVCHGRLLSLRSSRSQSAGHVGLKRIGWVTSDLYKPDQRPANLTKPPDGSGEPSCLGGFVRGSKGWG
jgi:hypothetical protein